MKLTGTPAFSNVFAYASRAGVVELDSMSFIGSATGKRYNANAGGIVFVQNAAATYLPGDAAGTTISGGLYV